LAGVGAGVLFLSFRGVRGRSSVRRSCSVSGLLPRLPFSHSFGCALSRVVVLAVQRGERRPRRAQAETQTIDRSDACSFYSISSALAFSTLFGFVSLLFVFLFLLLSYFIFAQSRLLVRSSALGTSARRRYPRISPRGGAPVRRHYTRYSSLHLARPLLHAAISYTYRRRGILLLLRCCAPRF